MELFPLSFGNLWLGGRISGFTKLHITNSTHHFWQTEKVQEYKKDQNCPCVMTDFVATIALGVISKNLEDVNDVKDKYLFEIIALQAPLLLLHLGGLDTITAYSLEDNKDNKFWLRHLLRLGVQTSTARGYGYSGW